SSLLHLTRTLRFCALFGFPFQDNVRRGLKPKFGFRPERLFHGGIDRQSLPRRQVEGTAQKRWSGRRRRCRDQRLLLRAAHFAQAADEYIARPCHLWWPAAEAPRVVD